MIRYGPFAYSASTMWLGYASQHDGPEAAKEKHWRIAAVGCGDLVLRMRLLVGVRSE
jgi:hypothetical protein